MSPRIGVAVTLAAITALGYLLFPAHTWLQQDTQIYVPILEHLYDASVLAHDPVATRPHVSYTIYDECAIALRHLTGASFHAVLAADQILFRAVAVFGVFLLATALGLSRRLALLVAAVYALGATVMGPAVLTVEYEPKPRGSAIGMVLLAVGLVGHRRYLAAGCAAGLAVLYHPPTSYPFLLTALCLVAWPATRVERKERLRLLIPVAAAGLLLLILSRFQAGGTEQQALFTRLTPELEELQRFRAGYNWIGTWAGRWIWHYLLLWGISLLALRSLGDALPRQLRAFLYGLPAVGMLSVPFSYLAYDVGKWALMAKFQPARALLWVSALAVILAAVACLRAARRNRMVEPLLWGFAAFAIPIQHNVWDLLLPDLADPVIRRRLLLVAMLAVLMTFTGWLGREHRRHRWAVWALAIVAPFVLIPSFGQVVTEKNMHHAELDQLSAWARSATPKDAVFLFPDTGKGRQPGIFRVKALRAIYADWKSGGQVNMVADFGRDWWERYSQTVGKEFDPADITGYPALGIDYIVLSPENRLPGRNPVYENGLYLVYALR